MSATILGVTGTKHAKVTKEINQRSWRWAVGIFLAARVLLSAWAATLQLLLPVDTSPDPILRPFLGALPLTEGLSGLLLGPWQRFDTMHYLAIARDGYSTHNSVFPPLYPLAMRVVGAPLQAIFSLHADTAHLLAGLLISNVAAVGLLVVLYRLTAHEIDVDAAPRALLYLVFFPVGFFLLTAYSESLFIFLAVTSLWHARQGRPVWAGLLGLLAALTRLTGWGLFVPLAYEYARRRGFQWRQFDWQALAAGLPVLGLVTFFAVRAASSLPSLSAVYQEYWYQTTGIPGTDLIRAMGTIVTGSGPRMGEFTLVFDFVTLMLLVATTVLVFRHLGPTFGLYNAMMLLFMLLPVSELKPLYSFSRYALAFFPSFMLAAMLGRNPWVHRLILYPSFALYFYFSGQYVMWGWVA